MTCPNCGTVREFAWDGGAHKCLTVGSSIVAFGPVHKTVTRELLAWLTARRA